MLRGWWSKARVVLPTAIGLGALAGAGVGGLVGTVIVPLLGTVGGGVVGACAGALAGLGSGSAIAVASARGAEVTGLRLVGGSAAGVCGLLEGTAALSRLTMSATLIVLLLTFAAGCTALGAWLAPWVAFPDIAATTRAVFGRATGSCAVFGTVVGALAGLGLGLSGYPPTAAFALVEGGALGAVIGVVIGFWAGLVRSVLAVGLVCPRRVPR